MALAAHHRHRLTLSISIAAGLLGAALVGTWQFRTSLRAWGERSAVSEPGPVANMVEEVREAVASGTANVQDAQQAALELLSTSMEQDLAKQRLIQEMQAQLQEDRSPDSP
jgi:hypothetical protein